MHFLWGNAAGSSAAVQVQPFSCENREPGVVQGPTFFSEQKADRLRPGGGGQHPHPRRARKKAAGGRPLMMVFACTSPGWSRPHSRHREGRVHLEPGARLVTCKDLKCQALRAHLSIRQRSSPVQFSLKAKLPSKVNTQTPRMHELSQGRRAEGHPCPPTRLPPGRAPLRSGLS